MSPFAHHRASTFAHHRVSTASRGAAVRRRARLHSEGPFHASNRALGRANAHSVLSRATPAANPLENLRTGFTVYDINGTQLGTITRINRSSDGTIRNVLVRTTSGHRRILPLNPTTLTLNGDVVTTTRLASASGRR
jgi:hypothetical protein